MKDNSFIIKDNATLSFKCANGNCYSLNIQLTDNALFLEKLEPRTKTTIPILFQKLEKAYEPSNFTYVKDENTNTFILIDENEKEKENNKEVKNKKRKSKK